jgi:hypothetical protein
LARLANYFVAYFFLDLYKQNQSGMKRGNDNRTGAQERTSMKDKSGHRNAQHSGRPNPSQNTINPNRGLNEDEQKRTTNQEEEDENYQCVHGIF